MPRLKELLLNHVANLTGLPVDALEANHSLLLQGVDSIGLMRTVNLLRKQGVHCSFDTLKQHPTLTAWLALLPDDATASSVALAEIPAQDLAQPIALTPVQQAYWMGRQEDQPLGANSCQVYIELQGADICPKRLHQACQSLVKRHLMLQVQFTAQGEQHVPVCNRIFSVEEADLRAMSADQVDVRLQQYRQQFSHYLADVEQGWPLRVALSRLPGNVARLHLNIDLLVADVLSINVLLRDMGKLYNQPDKALPPLKANFFQYLYLQGIESKQRYPEAKAYWQQRLSSLPGAPALPLAQQPEMVTKPRFTRRDYLLKHHQLAILQDKAKQHGTTLAVVFLTLYCEVLARWSENKHFLINVPLFNRNDLVPDVGDMVADFTTLLLLEVDFRQPASFVQRVQQLQSQLHRDIAQADYSGVEVLRDLARLEGTAPRTAPVVFALNLGEPFLPEVAEQTLGTLHWMISQTPQVWIDHQSYPTREGLLLNWDSVDSLFPDEMVSSMFSCWLARLHTLIEQEWRDVPDISLPPVTQAMRSRVNATALSIESARLHDGFFEQAKHQPHAPAVITADRTTSYQELAQRALQIGFELRQRGVKPEDIVAINLPKGIEQIATVLGVLATGACWLPLAVDHPLARRITICQRAEVVCVITHQAEPWPESELVYQSSELISHPHSHALKTPVSGNDETLAYVIYTSGSTGEPKGVAITHRAAWNTIATLNRRFGITHDDRVLAISGLEFDLSVYDIFGLLSAGGALVMPDEDKRRDPDSWRSLAQQHAVTLWNSVPALLEMLLLTTSNQPFLPTLRQAWVSGDRVAPDLAKRLRQRIPHPVRVIAMGGATEAAIWSNAFEIMPETDSTTRVPYGYPLANQKFRVMDTHHSDCPDGVPGELWIGGVGLARGYIGDAAQTDRRFVEYQGERWYRTGDRGCYSEDGLLHFLGRQDHQVKVDGNRIELTEIESALQQLPSVIDAFCLVVNQRLEAVLTSDNQLDTAVLLATLAAKLPAYMLPSRIHTVSNLPLTANGKVNRAALEKMIAELAPQATPLTEACHDESPLHAQLRLMWQEILEVNVCDIRLTFFQAGGNSLQAMRLVNRINQTYGVQLSLRQFLSNATLAALATFITSTCSANTTTEEGAL